MKQPHFSSSFRRLLAIFLYFGALSLSHPLFSADGENTLSLKSWKLEKKQDALQVVLTVPAGMYAYADATGPDFSPKVTPSSTPKFILHHDPVSGEPVPVFSGPGRFVWTFSHSPATFPAKLDVRWQACSADGVCHLPGEAGIAVFPSEKAWREGSFSPPSEALEQTLAPQQDGIPLMPDHHILRSASGYLPPAEFAAFLRGENFSSFSLKNKGFWATLVLVLLGGLALNLTPCVLPLVPVNLAMIGAGGASEKPRLDRILRGLVYGAGIAISYGLLGVLAVLSGSTFGVISGSWLFNAAVALIFLALGLAMFDVFQLDFSRFGSNLRLASSLHYTGIFLMGALSAVLAGACVAPVLVAVLIQAAGLYGSGNPGGLFLPFLLGTGMALPWPFAAAGLALFPKPGAWMIHVKHALGVLIFLLAAYYAWMALSLLPLPNGAEETAPALQNASPAERIAAALAEAEKTSRPVLLDFGASWCKNCVAMERNTFPDPEVRNALKDMILVKINAEDPAEPATKALLERFQVRGLPYFLLLAPGKNPRPAGH